MEVKTLMVNFKTSNKNILFIFEDSRYGGPHSNFLNFYDKLKLKLNISVLYTKKESNLFGKKLVKKKIKAKKIDLSFLSLKFDHLLLYCLNFFFDIFKIKREITEKNFDFVCVYTGIYSIKSLIACILSNKKIIWYMHDTYQNYINQFIFRFFFSKVYKVIFSSKKSRKAYLNNNLSTYKTTVLHSVIDIKQKVKTGKINNNKISIISAGNFSPVKNFEFFLDIANINKKNKNFDFFLVGNTWNTQNGYLEKILKIKKEREISNLKIIQNQNLLKYLRKADYFFCTSISESSPLLILEAIKNDCIIFSTNVGDVKDSLRRYKYGYIIDKKNIKQISTKIIQIEKSKLKKSKLLSNGKNYLHDQHNVNNYVKKFLLKVIN